MIDEVDEPIEQMIRDIQEILIQSEIDVWIEQRIGDVQIILRQVEAVAARGPLSPEWEAVQTAGVRLAALVNVWPV